MHARLGTRAVAALSVSILVGTVGHPAHAADAPLINGPVAYSDGTHWIEVNPDGSDDGGRHLVTPSGGGYDPADGVQTIHFTADGTRAVFQGGEGVWLSDSDGTHAGLLWQTPSGATDQVSQISSDGQTVYFTRYTWSATINQQVGTIMSEPLAGGTPAPVDVGPFSNPDTGGAEQPVVSPDGRYMALLEAHQLAVVDLATKQGQWVGTAADHAHFSPDGKQLIVDHVDSVDSSRNALIAFAEDGSGTGTVLPGSQGRTYAGWSLSPDGTKIAFSVLVHPLGASADRWTIGVFDLSQGTYLGEVPNSSVATGLFSIDWLNGPDYTGPVTPPPPPPPAKIGPAVHRDAGADRVQTAIAISQQRWTSPGQADAVVLATSQNYPDALAGGPLAARVAGPLLLTDGGADHLDPAVEAEIQRLKPADHDVYVLGGDHAMNPAIVARLKALGYSVIQFKGTDRYDTALRIAKDGLGSPSHVVLATGTGFADALAAGPYAAGPFQTAQMIPAAIVLSHDGTLDPATSAYLAGKTVATVGWPAARAWPHAAESFAGSDRFATAALVAAQFTGRFAATQAGIANGMASADNPGYPDALTGGAFMAESGGPIILVDGVDDVLPAASRDALAARSDNVRADVFGGVGVIPADLEQKIITALNGFAAF